ncbi:cation:proton antiporter [Hippea maritima]|uniref:Sodium/hydrogen exchanger n=1 Tax=Hippea maritima (strain ATCC 700847 / DSM 10411 / MH2) TaxID=760142 RepID=F2LTN3_HIPMA|nr:cation:proton antiporter [Hippea maritima]AEA33358.1 sodium/hydrogen exchanger [Hippea maritima DSM 10411]
MNVNQSISLFLVVLATFSAPMLAKILRIPVVVAEILAGIILGPTILNIVSHSAFLHFLSEFGFLLLMFYVGLEIEIKEMNPKLIILNIAAFIINAIFSYFIVRFLNVDFIWMAVFVSASVGVVIGVLREMNLLDSKVGKLTLYSGIMQEFIILLIVTSYEIYKSENYSLIKYALIILSIVLTILFFRVVKLLHWWYPEYFNYFASSKDPLSLRIRFVLAVMLLSVSFAFYFNIDPVVGAFIAGLVISISFADLEMIKEDVGTIGLGFFIPLFFVYTGVNVKINFQDLPFVGIVVVLMFLSHLGSVIVFYFNKFPLPRSLILSLNLSKGVSMVVLIMTLARAEGLVNQRTFSTAILIGIVAEIFYTIVFKNLYGKFLSNATMNKIK